ncbi:hypothetical protein Q1695_002018 [Nippostrongylus brasiliensis]|nr:hypothetical protein Q1695_002018 [Nippostrongylus brasiliensis]
MDIWSLAKEKLRENEEKAAASEDRDGIGDGRTVKSSTHIVICGNAQSGKSVLVNKFLDRNEEPKETIALEYIYARRTRGNNKDICHIWELGGGTKLAQLLAVPLVKDNIEALSIILVLDLTRPNELWITMEQLLTTSARHTEAAIKELGEKRAAALRSRMKARIADMKDDVGSSAPFPVPLLINFDSEQRRRICSTLRFIAHYYGAHLIFYSRYNEQLVRVGRSMLSHLAFGTSVPKTKVDDHNKPLFVTAGMDSFESIGPPPGGSMAFSRAGQPIHLWRSAFCDHFKQTEHDSSEKTNDEQQLFQEPLIDNLIAQREKDLDMYIRQKKDRQAAEARAAEKINSF